MSDPVNQIWEWIHEPLQRLTDECRQSPETLWDERLPEFLSALGVGSVDDHPVLRLLADHVESLGSHEEQVAFLAGDELDTQVYTWAQQVAPEAEPEPAGYEEDTESTATALPPEEAAEQVVRTIALAVVTELATNRPDLVGHLSTEEVHELISQALAERLATA